MGKQQSELARLRVLGGPDSGVVFIMTTPRVTIGRGEDNDIILGDIKASRKHAEIVVQDGNATITDLGSSHGFMVNGNPLKQAQLRNGDKIGLGTTVLEYVGGANQGATQMLVRPPVQTSKVVGTINSNSGLTQFIQRPQAAASAPSKLAGDQGFLVKNKKLVLMLGGLMVITGLLPEAQNQINKKNPHVKYVDPQAASNDNEPSILSQEDAKSDAFKSSNLYFKLGMREFNSKNYLRAMNAFETAIQIYGNHKLASVYLRTTKKRMEEEAEEHFKHAKLDEAANRTREAIDHLSAIRRLYTSDQSNPIYKDADKKITELEKNMVDMEKEYFKHPKNDDEMERMRVVIRHMKLIARQYEKEPESAIYVEMAAKIKELEERLAKKEKQ
ncbi:MAG: FHA domain-containing protein [Deltaproteobacteria bacterium]|nr:FHA domain-containing protein [Deltaproteobacteria bacterium]